MQLLCIAALLLSAVAAQPDFWSPSQDGPKLDADSESVTQAPEDGDLESGVDWTEWDAGHPWLLEMPPWIPNQASRRPGNERPWRPIKGTDGNDHQPEKPSQAPDFMSEESGVPLSGQGRRRLRRHRGPSRGKRPNRRNPGAIVFSPTFKVDNVTFQNTTDVPLKEGENLFVMPKHGGRGPHHRQGGRYGPPKDRQYVKLFYNATQPNKVSIEFGVLKPMNLGEIVGKEDNPEEDY